jgi:hypothetical protein
LKKLKSLPYKKDNKSSRPNLGKPNQQLIADLRDTKKEDEYGQMPRQQKKASVSECRKVKLAAPLSCIGPEAFTQNLHAIQRVLNVSATFKDLESYSYVSETPPNKL